jgi:hypothetical protein
MLKETFRYRLLTRAAQYLLFLNRDCEGEARSIFSAPGQRISMQSP